MKHSYDHNCYCSDCCNHEVRLHNVMVTRDTRGPTMKASGLRQWSHGEDTPEYPWVGGGSAKEA